MFWRTEKGQEPPEDIKDLEPILREVWRGDWGRRRLHDAESSHTRETRP